MTKKEMWRMFAIEAYEFTTYNVRCCECCKNFEKDEKYLCFVVNEVDYEYDPIDNVFEITNNLCKKCFFEGEE